MPETPTPQTDAADVGGLSVLECAVIGLAVGAALYVGWSAYQQWRADRARRQVIDADSVEVPTPTVPFAHNVRPQPATSDGGYPIEESSDAAG